MAKSMLFGIKVIFGVREPKPIVGAPAGRTRLCMRNDRVASLFVRTTTAIREFILEDRGDHWFADPELEQLYRTKVYHQYRRRPMPFGQIFRLNPGILSA